MKHIWVLLISVLLCSHPQRVFSQSTLKAEVLAGSDFRGFLDGQGEKTMFDKPTAIAVDKEGVVYVWDSINRRIRRITKDGAVTSHPRGTLGDVTSLASLPEGKIAVADGGRIRVFDSSGNVSDMSDTRFGSMSAIAVDLDGSILVADTGNNKIHRVSTNGQVTTLAGSGNRATVDGEGLFSSFSDPDGIAVNSVGTIFVHQANESIRTIQKTGRVQTTQLRSGSKHMVFDSTDKLYVASGSHVLQYSPNFVEGYTFNVAIAVGGIAVDSDDNIFVSDSGGNKIYRVPSPSKQVLSSTILSIKMYPGVTITGQAPGNYRIEATDTLEGRWIPLEIIQLNDSPRLWIDQTSVNGQRFYRAVLLE